MHSEVKRSDLIRALAAADGIAKPSTMPLLECVLISATGDDVVTVVATDTQLAIRATLASKNRKAGSIAISAKRLREVIKGAPEESISIAALNNNYIEIRSGKARYKLASLPARDFPKIPEMPSEASGTTIGSEDLKRLIDRVLFSTSNDITRMHLCAALLVVAPNRIATLTSTDGHRMSRANCPCEASDFTALVPAEALAKIAKIADGDVEIMFHKPRIFVRVDGLTFSSPIVDMEFPPIDQIIPKSQHVVSVDPAVLIASIERTRIAVSETHGMAIDGREAALVLSSEHPDIGEVSDEIGADGEVAEIASCVAPKYLIEPLSRFTDDVVKLQFNGELDPVVIESSSGDYTAVIMPMRRG